MHIETLTQLLQIAIGTRSTESFRALPDEEWDKVFADAKKQAVVGLLSQAVFMLPQELMPYRKLKLELAFHAQKIQTSNQRLNECSAKLYADLHALGLRSCLLKGQGTALLYKDPSLRQVGDIDMWVAGGTKAVLNILRSKWTTKEVFYHHVDVDVFGKLPHVEIHFTPSWMNNPFSNRKLQAYFSAQEEAQLERLVPGVSFPVPDPCFNLVYNMAHLYRHLLFEGLGLRQIIDYYYILESSAEQQRCQVSQIIDSLGMRRFAQALMFVLRELLHMDSSLFLSDPSAKYGKQLLEVISLGGNFGKHDARNKGFYSHSAPVRLYLRMKRLLAFALAYPSEVLWAPYYKIWQFLWRRKFN